MSNVNIVYFSLTGNTRAFANRFMDDHVVTSINDPPSDKPFVIFTPTYNFGKVPIKVERYLNENHNNLKGVVAFGNINWGADIFGRAGDLIRDKHNVPLLGKIDLRGTDDDYKNVKGRLQFDE